jgi:glycosyltransferase involved in cell wall biosynthesis
LNTIVIPTRNRPELLTRLVNNLVSSIDFQGNIVIVDSSDPGKESKELSFFQNVSYSHTNVKSAAIQRNIGIDAVRDTEFLFFLDDDVIPPEDYFDEISKLFKDDEVVGVSGIAINSKQSGSRQPPNGILGLYLRVFQLDSKKDGKLLKSGVNIPVRNSNDSRIQVDWLIGCSAWRFNMIDTTRFEEDFMGQSLGEDVIFSVRMRSKGTLITSGRIRLSHDESDIERPNRKDFWEMWVVNRSRIIRVAKFGFTGKIAFWWANLGQIIILTYAKIRKIGYKEGSVFGLLSGCYSVMRRGE